MGAGRNKRIYKYATIQICSVSAENVDYQRQRMHVDVEKHVASVLQRTSFLLFKYSSFIMPLPLIGGGIKRCFCLTSV